jgi:hypothetical protein
LLAALENNRPPTAPEPIDEDRLTADLQMLIIAVHDGDKGATESVLTALLHAALNDREDFYRRYAKVDAPSYGIHQVHPENAKAYREAVEAAHRQKADHLRRAVIANFTEQEWCHATIDVLFPHWQDNERLGLSPMRPCRPAGGYVYEPDDETVSEIGKLIAAAGGVAAEFQSFSWMVAIPFLTAS